MRRTVFLLSLLVGIAAPPLSRADYETPLTIPLHLDVNGGWGYSSASGQALSATTKLGQWNVGATAGVLIGSFLFAGLSSDYHSSAQYSEVNSNDGNFSGKRWNLASPTAGFRSRGFVLKFDYQLLGDYELMNRTANGSSIKYTSPKGWRIAGLYQIAGIVHAGAFYENLSFAKQVDSASGEMALSPSVKLSQFGASLGLVF